MLYEETPRLQKFVVDYLQRAGAVADQAGYAALEVLLPEDLVGHFGEEQLLLAFDYEVAEENEGSLFITHGSPFLDKTVESVLQSLGRCTTRYRSGPPPELPRNFEQKVLAKLEFQRCRPPRISMHTVEEYVFYGFNFRCTFRSHEKSDQIVPIVLNGSNGQAQPDFLLHWQKNASVEEREHSLPRAQIIPEATLYKIACREAEQAVQVRAEKILAQGAGQKKKELEKIASYYNELVAELQKKLVGTEDSVKKARLEKQLTATLADRERREKDASERYGVEVEIRLDHVVTYHVPCLWAKLELMHKDKVLFYPVIYNPIINGIETPVCEHCGQQTLRLVPDKDDCLVCPECSEWGKGKSERRG